MKNDFSALISNEFPQDGDLMYLNHAAVSPWPKRTADAVHQFADENVHLGASRYPEWLVKEKQLRKQLQKLLNAHSVADIALLKNTSEALSVVAEGICWSPGDNIVTSNQEFPSNRIPWQAQQNKQVELRQVDLDSSESPEQALIDACDKKTKILAISSVQYASGLKMDLMTLGNYCHDHGIIFCVDAIQSLGAHSVDVQNAKIDCLMADAHKWMMGPEGIAVFYCNEKLRDILRLHQFGWHMVEDVGNYDRKDWNPAGSARRFECGSPNMLGIHALSASISLIDEIGQERIDDMIENKVRYLIDSLTGMGFSLLSPIEPSRRVGIVNFIPGDLDINQLYQKLMANRLICAHRGGGIRLSPHFYTSEDLIDNSLEVISLNI